MRHSLVVVLATLVLAAPGRAAERRVVTLPGTDLGLPFSPGVVAGDFLYLAGAIGNVPGTRELPTGVEAQVRQTMENLGAVLKAEGMDFSRVASSTVFLSDVRHYQPMNEVYRSYFPKDPPTRATVEADIAIPGALVEIAMVAIRPGAPREVIRPKGLGAPDLPYSWGIRSGSTLFVAGATSRDPETRAPLPGDTAFQTRQELENVGKVLEAAGMGYGDVVSCNVFLGDARSFGAMNETYKGFFPQPRPARATVRARLMNPIFDSEIQCVAVKDAGRKRVAEGEGRPDSPFSPAIQVGDFLYLAGFVGRGAEGFAAGDVAAQTRQALARLQATLAAAGMDFSNVVNAQVYLSDIRHYGDMNAVYAELLPKPPPARATVGARLMSPDALVEIMMIAVR